MEEEAQLILFDSIFRTCMLREMEARSIIHLWREGRFPERAQEK
ncbi:uncharacterized protein G2W53_039240 [Senna tora]|uniref:Uncharacterized protein n=1 Tax=Senna tora TaxID=362788 RepID=A0A834W7T6_9FABA|nr:uncharacterized protein G2W53_039240 [Senna tora]